MRLLHRALSTFSITTRCNAEICPECLHSAQGVGLQHSPAGTDQFPMNPLPQTANTSMPNLQPVDHRLLQESWSGEAEPFCPAKMEPAAAGGKRQAKGKRGPSAASLAQKKYMERQKVSTFLYSECPSCFSCKFGDLQLGSTPFNTRQGPRRLILFLLPN